MKAEYSTIGSLGGVPSRGERWWLREIGAWTGSALLLMCIVIVLSVYDGKPRPTLHGGITFNALIAVIIKVGLLLLMVPLAAAVGQWKWTRVETARSLKEFVAISDAAQKPWASLELLLRLRGGAVAAAGAILVLSTQGIETFVQQSVKYPLNATRIDTPATLPVSNLFRSQALTNGDTPPDFGMKTAVYNGLFAPNPHTAFPVIPSCSGANCTWQEHYSLGFCNNYTDITDQVRANSAQNHYSLPNGLILKTQDTVSGEVIHYYNASIKDVSNDGLDVSSNDYTLQMTFLAIHTSPDATKNSPVASRCTLGLCIRNYISASYGDGRLKEDIVPGSARTLTFSDACPVAGSDLTYTANDQSWEGFAIWLNTLVSGSYKTPNSIGEPFDASTDSRNAIYQALIGQRGDLDTQSLFDNVAESLTRAVRTSDATNNGSPGPVSTGTTYVNHIIVKVDWAWLSFPFTVWILTLLYLFAVIFMSRGHPSWKDETIATLCHGLDDTSMLGVASLQSVSDMEYKAKTLYVRLAALDSGYKLSKAAAP